MRLILHTGAGKTGTSAIQAALAQLRPDLATAGILYPLADNGPGSQPDDEGVARGNAGLLGSFLNPNKHGPSFSKAAIFAWLDGILAEAAGRDILLSSEAMQFVRGPQAAELVHHFVARGYDTTVIFYVRHVLDHAISGYLQNLKRGQIGADAQGKRRSQAAFFRAFRCPFAASLEPFAAVLPPERLIVRLYDKERPTLVDGFLRLVSDHPFPKVAGERIFNRSPTAAEQVVFTELARLESGDRLCRTLQDLMLDTPTSEPTDVTLTEEQFTAFAERNQSVVDAINQTWLKGHGELRMKSDRIRIGAEEPVSQASINAAFARAIALLDGANRARQRAANRETRRRPG